MTVQVGAARMMGDGSGDASVSVVIDGGRKRQVRVCPDMNESWLLFTVDNVPRLIHFAAAIGRPHNFIQIPDPVAVSQILASGREVMSNPKLQAGVLRAIRKRKERERKERVASCSIRLKASIMSMFQAGATHDEVMTYVNEALVGMVQEA